MNCYLHTDRPTVAPCSSCGNFICDECAVKISGNHFCKQCLAEAHELPMEMSQNNPSSPAKRITRSRTNSMVGGVCGGIAKYYNVDPAIVRFVTGLAILILLPYGLSVFVVIVYLLAWVTIPKETDNGWFSDLNSRPKK